MRIVRNLNGDSGSCAPGYPVIRISAAGVSASVYLPDPERGYYRGTRFDRGGLVGELTFGGHSYFGEWLGVHDPFRHDAVCGPADEFGQVGYEDAAPGGIFLKIGVGLLRKPLDGTPYDRFRLYEIADPGVRETTSWDDGLLFIHALESPDYACVYRKRLQLTAGRPGFRIDYSFTNQGRKAISTDFYNHNFFTIDNAATTPATTIFFPFKPAGNWRRKYDSVELTDDGIRFLRPLSEEETVFMGDLHGFAPRR